MERNNLLRANYLDIIFDGRNKAYGGYELRSKYADRARKATATVLLGVALIAAIPIIAGALSGHTTIAPPVTTITDLKVLEIPKPEVQPPVHIEEPPAPVATISNPVPHIVPDEIADTQPPAVEDLEGRQIAMTTTDGPSTDGSLIPSGPTGGGTTLVEAPAPPAEILTFVDIPPQFEGDLPAYLQSHLRYPDEAREVGTEGRVGVQFVVNEDGSISNATLISKSAPSLEAEALRVVRSMPKWKPGRQAGKAVKVYFTLPITFRLD